MALEHLSDSVLAKAVRDAGSQSAFARLVGKRQSVINGWLKVGRVSHHDVLLVERMTLISRYDLRPDLYPREVITAGDHACTGMEPAR